MILTSLMFTAGHFVLAEWDEVRSPKIVEKEVAMAREIPEILRKIAKCESNGLHTKNGKVLMVNGDVGKYQISLKHWYAKSNELGLNIYNEEDNEKFALWLYENRGTEDWYLTKKCWSK